MKSTLYYLALLEHFAAVLSVAVAFSPPFSVEFNHLQHQHRRAAAAAAAAAAAVAVRTPSTSRTKSTTTATSTTTALRATKPQRLAENVEGVVYVNDRVSLLSTFPANLFCHPKHNVSLNFPLSHTHTLSIL